MPTKGIVIVVALMGAAGLSDARSFWSSKPAVHGLRSGGGVDDYILKTAYPVGNGRLGAMQYGPPGAEKLILNVDSLWSGGPFMANGYSGGNPKTEKHSALPGIRNEIFDTGFGDVSPLLGSGANFGAYRTLGNFSVEIDGIVEYHNYKRSLDLTTGVHTTTFKANSSDFSSTVFCSYPDQVCVYMVSTTGSLPVVKIRFANKLVERETYRNSCGSSFTRITGVTQVGPPEGMKYDAIARVAGESRATTECGCRGILAISVPEGQKSLTVVISARTNFDQTKGNAEHGYSFKGESPEPLVERVTSLAAAKSYEDLLRGHIEDYSSLQGAFTLDIADTKGSAEIETSELILSYSADGSGDPFLEGLLFDFSRHLLISSSRDNSLPANLAGRWTEELWPAWSGDYHANINLQMNYWAADQTGLSKTQGALWDYMEHNWVPRGTETAKLLYGAASGWVVHNEMNIFGHTAMKEGASWAHYPAANAWMMQHVWDNYEYTQDGAWFARQGYPLIKGTTQFWLSQLQEDTFFKDGSLVVNPCNSPEHGETTFGCTHYHQEIHRTFDSLLAGADVAGETDVEFLADVRSALTRLDKGVHVAGYGGLKEWKLPDGYGLPENSTHRHLSHLTGWHPGYSVSGLQGGYANGTVQSAVRQTLLARGHGSAPDGNAGWGKVWRAACWARLNATEEAHFHLRYAIATNFAANGLSMYSARNEPFQIDANFGLGGAVLSMLVVDLPLAHDDGARSKGWPRTVVLGPAIPASWGGGSVKGLRIRGGGSVDFGWDADGLVTKASLTGSKTDVRLVNVRGDPL